VSSAIHIAILDDEVDITLLLANYLQGHGYRVTQLHEGRALLALMPTDPPALVLLDVRVLDASALRRLVDGASSAN
jgi:two-component system, OmpR family, response regulator